MQLNNEIRIGLLFSLTGTTSVTERGAYQAALLAIRQVNDRGGIHGTRLVPVTEDIASDPRLSAEKAEKLIRQEQVSTIIGLYTSACRKVTIPILEKYNKLLFYPALYEGEELSPNVFYCGPVPNQQLEYFIPWILQNVGPSVYLIGSDYVYPKETHKHIRRLVKVHGGTISGEHYAALGAQKFHQVIKTIENLAPHAVFSTLVGESALIFYQQFRDANLNIPIASSITGETEIQAMGAKYAEGHYTSFPYFSSVVTEKNQQFRKLYSENYGTAAVSFVMESAYFSVWLLAEAIRKTNSIETDRIRMALQGMTFDAPQGGIRVDEDNQHIWLQSRIGRANAKGEFDIVWESDGPIPPLPFYSIESKDRQEEHTHDVASIELLRSTQEQYGLLIKIIQDISQFFSYRFAIFNPEGIT
ncbi:transporter substrate-binding domain-containing protein [Fodinisporobacter ferrooxydans]|uniref:Transporter substrate-binding domain-containing protein n=1 Tax=Fodinisporobacter ferrooxydans TaxID=2901836 RepID=A0ABY4CER0_9BACL|nr:transporter substrate-binding domain-containing protein [Alicyclobacillaceae bacterium MYW30-H2]